MKPTRRLAAIMFTDMVGFSSMVFKDETTSKEVVGEQRKIIRQYIQAHEGKEIETTGDGFLIEFASAVEAVQCAVEIQTYLYERSKHHSLDREIKIRIGIHLGDLLIEGNHYHGNAVNIAARIEPLAPAGGICISRQVYDQVVGKICSASLKKIGHKKIKNIESGVEIYQVEMSWQNKKRPSGWSQLFRKSAGLKSISPNGGLLAGLFTMSLLMLFGIVTSVPDWSSKELLTSSRGPASASESGQDENNGWKSIKVNLANDWSYLLESSNDSHLVNSMPDMKSSSWKPFEVGKVEKYVNIIQGKYWLKKEFLAGAHFENPGLVLGLIADKHRAFLNGKFIGGSDHLSDVAAYAFDDSLLRQNEVNVLLIQAEARQSLKPGLTILPNIGAYLSEFSIVRKAVIKNNITFHLMRNIYFILSLVIFVSCLTLALFQKNKSGYFYSAFYLLLGSIHLAYYTPWVNESFDYSAVRFLKSFSMAMSSFVLFSGFLNLRKKYKAELINNMLALTVACSIAFVLLGLKHTPASYMQIYNAIFVAAAAYSVLWSLYSLFDIISNWKKEAHSLIELSGVFLFFGICGTISFLSAITNSPLPSMARELMKDTAVSFPFIFALLAIVTGTWSYVKETRVTEVKKRRDEFTLELIRIINTSPDPLNAIQIVQKKISEFVQATKSTIYVFDNQEKQSNLKLIFDLEKSQVAREFKQRIDPNSGVIGYVVNNKSPLAIDNVRTDPRFTNRAKYEAGVGKNYRTGSCMIFPLFSNSKLIGVLTFADKKEDATFSQLDFKAALEFSSVLGILTDNSQMKQAILSQSKVS